jgi:hypothetical protein
MALGVWSAVARAVGLRASAVILAAILNACSLLMQPLLCERVKHLYDVDLDLLLYPS